jgi:hypothetical protein
VPHVTGGQGYDYFHCAEDDHSRLAYVEAHRDEKVTTCSAVLRRGQTFYADHGISVQAVMTDNARAYRNSLLV